MDWIVIQMYSFRTMLGTVTTVGCPTQIIRGAKQPTGRTQDQVEPQLPDWVQGQASKQLIGSQSHSPNRKYIGHGNTMDLIRVRIQWTECSTVDPIILKQGYGGFEGLSLNILNLMLRWSISWSTQDSTSSDFGHVHLGASSSQIPKGSKGSIWGARNGQCQDTASAVGLAGHHPSDSQSFESNHLSDIEPRVIYWLHLVTVCPMLLFAQKHAKSA